ncbi:MAG: phage tail protein [Alcanivorax sp.]|jgi:phage tail-like protein|uniref:phage tail protein n=1 Tax=unclassified Ketobacter TaxID=2639109 RepID=UPI000C658601|nr:MULTISPECIES: phage tail protein [unclassified Ketobacter]MAA60716.1 phage tail protein [Pseudomonadales bacterium]MEC8812008.1 phage tail protein [Pseudomonadota bacterium]TNC89443.1 MAG: phage tail protein [Alcanivorax sp.]HAG96320.1 phage tail protein [Gammaproteobacteria bacterium]MBI25431.1 phage tail protein [Pseudomonadales bacterium]|tara:strand:+ start:357 stop:818 length:462 start_codon:yes stop_codon:yes gene_type:complete
MAQFRETPYSVFNYLVNLDDGTEGEIAGGFSEVSGLNAEVTVAEYRNGNAPVNYVTKIPAIHKSGDVTLKRGVIGADNIYSWLDQVRSGDVTAKRNVTIKLKNEDPTSSSAVVTWKLVNAMPIKWTGPTLTAKGGSDVAIEELVLAVEQIEQE